VSDASHHRTSTIVSGVALSAGIVLAGLVFLRRRRAAGSWLAVGLVTAAGLFSYSGYLFANAPAPQPRPSADVLSEQDVEIVVVDNGHIIKLLIPPDTKLGDPSKANLNR
jgi:hypothetical protein